MPEVDGKKFPYTAKGRDQAAQYRKRLKKKKKRVGRSVKTPGGIMLGSFDAPTRAKPSKPVKKDKQPKEEKMPKKKKKSDQSKQSAKRAKRRGSKKAPGRPLTASEEAYFQGKRYA